jgi:hypothetical protein
MRRETFARRQPERRFMACGIRANAMRLIQTRRGTLGAESEPQTLQTP